jgi:hypothetical protein
MKRINPFNRSLTKLKRITPFTKVLIIYNSKLYTIVKAGYFDAQNQANLGKQPLYFNIARHNNYLVQKSDFNFILMILIKAISRHNYMVIMVLQDVALLKLKTFMLVRILAEYAKNCPSSTLTLRRTLRIQTEYAKYVRARP